MTAEAGARRRMLALANPGAGSAEQEGITAVLEVLREAADVEAATSPDAISRIDGRDLVVIGGDGSLHRALQALVDGELMDTVGTVGLVPMGTGNDVARSRGLPFDPRQAAHVALHGEVRDADLLLDDAGGVVVNVVHLGIGANATAGAEGAKGLLGTAGYAVGAVRAGLTSIGWRLRVTVDGAVVADGSRPCLMVALALGTSIGGGAPVAPQASPSDHLADVVISWSTGPLARVGFALALRDGSHLDRDDVQALRARVVTVDAVTPEERFRVNADGEVGEPVAHRSWRLLPRAWRLRVPDPAPDDRDGLDVPPS